MEFIKITLILIYAYLVGSIPFGYFLVHLTTGKDIRLFESGRTGGTNAARVAGIWTGILTAFLDGLKAASTVWLSRYFIPGFESLYIIAPLVAIIGHNYSIFFVYKNNKGKLSFKGGAGGAPCAGGAVGLWFPSILIVAPMALLIIYIVGYASITTMSIALIVMIIFAIRAFLGASPWIYVLYGAIAEILLIVALRPNIKRLIQGNERIVGLRAKKQSKN